MLGGVDSTVATHNKSAAKITHDMDSNKFNSSMIAFPFERGTVFEIYIPGDQEFCNTDTIT
jgi:hypothetical protein